MLITEGLLSIARALLHRPFKICTCGRVYDSASGLKAPKQWAPEMGGMLQYDCLNPKCRTSFCVKPS